eukprot:6183522-Pleurochrysis_carterae.AAC.1
MSPKFITTYLPVPLVPCTTSRESVHIAHQEHARWLYVRACHWQDEDGRECGDDPERDAAGACRRARERSGFDADARQRARQRRGAHRVLLRRRAKHALHVMACVRTHGHAMEV